MPELYLTPASTGYLSQFLLTLIITTYLASRSLGRGKKFTLRPDGALLACFTSLTLLSLLFFLDYSALPAERLGPAFLEPPAVSLLLAALIQFAYDFPAPTGKHRLERWLALFFSGYYLYREVSTAIYRFQKLPTGWVVFRGSDLDTMMAVGFAWVVFIFARQAIQNWKQPTTRNFALLLLIPLGLAAATSQRGLNPLVTFWYPIAASIGLLLTIFLFTLNYLSSQPERVSFVVKLSGAILTSVLAVFGVIPWLVAPAYAAHYESPLQRLDHRTLHFSPGGQGGYQVSAIPFQWEANYGQGVDTSRPNWDRFDFKFSFFGKPYQQVFVSHFCAIGMKSNYWGNYQYNFASVPMMMPLLVDLNEYEHPNGNYYVSVEDGRFIFTCLNMPAHFNTGARYTLQIVLFSDGSFNFNYNGLPPLKFYVDDFPDKTAWAVGVKPAEATARAVDFTNLPLRIGPDGAIQDEYRAFRLHLHQFLLPLAAAVVASSLFFLTGAILVLNYGLARPLNALLEGVQNFNKGQRDTAIPVQSNDEIGFLTESFNAVGRELNSLINGLEQRVTERTAQLRTEMDARAAAQAQVLEQQRAVTRLEERERMARELHDGIGQVLGFLNVQAQSADDAVQAGDRESASQLLARMVEVAQEAHDDVRGYILGLKKDAARPRQDFSSQLEQYCQHLLQNFGFRVRLNLPAALPPVLADSTVETQLLYVIRESLSNARAHSGQLEAEVTLTFDATHARAVIADQGTGFDPVYIDPDRRKSGHFGLGIMRERAEQAGGSLEIESTAEAGTRVTVRLPRQIGTASQAGRRVLLVDDHPLFLEGLANLVTGRGLAVVGTACDGLEAQEKARALRPEVILMDIDMPRCGGLEATRRIKAEMPEVKVVMLTVSGEEWHLFEALQSGASGYLLKSLEAGELTGLLDELLRGEVSLSPGLANKMLEAFTRHKAPPSQPPGLHPAPESPSATEPAGLSERQSEILRLVAEGLQYKQVAMQLGLTEVTIKYHVGEILARLHLASRQEAIQYLREGKLK